MSWAKLDDGLDEHRKVEQLLEGHTELGMLDGDALQELAGLAAIGLWTLGLTNTSRRLTEGHLSKRVLRALAPTTNQLLTDRLVEVGLFDPDQTGVQIHDYLDHNPSRDDVVAQRTARIEAGRKGGKRSGESRRGGQQPPPDDEKRRRAAAAARANTALKAGRIQHGPCVDCGAPGEEMHHFDYDLPEEIVWYCRKHHTELHSVIARAGAQATASATASAGASTSGSSSGEPRTRTPTTASVERAGAHEPDLPTVSYRGKHVARQVVEHAATLLDTFNDATKRSIGSTKGDGTASADLKQIVGALIAHPDVDVDAWKRAIRHTVANPPRWVEGQLQTGHVFGERAAAHALANTGTPAAGPRNGAQSADGARGAELLAGALRGADG